MRRRILDSTVSCLQEYGYVGTSITRVVEHAGITRGALAHHFSTKSDLVATAVGHVAAARTSDLIAKSQQARNVDDPIDAALELLWSVHEGTMFIAVAEVWVAARSDPELQRRIVLLEQATNTIMVEMARTLSGSTDVDHEVRNCIYTAMDTIRGVLMSQISIPDRPREYEARWRRAKAHLRGMFELALAEPNPDA